ncbi:MAG: universal stress protein [Deltaproteobacteria bacterium]|nr:universal stress protein [Deltaproteobacteria bacterium]
MPGRAEREAARLSVMAGARLILLHVIEKCYNSGFLATDSPEWKAIHDSWFSEARSLLDKKEEAIREQGCYSIKKEVRCGELVFEVAGVAVEQGASVIVAPICRGFSLKGLLAQSFSSRLMELSPCPVMLINEQDQAASM